MGRVPRHSRPETPTPNLTPSCRSSRSLHSLTSLVPRSSLTVFPRPVRSPFLSLRLPPLFVRLRLRHGKETVRRERKARGAGWQEHRESIPPIDLTSLVLLSRVPSSGSSVASSSPSALRPAPPLNRILHSLRAAGGSDGGTPERYARRRERDTSEPPLLSRSARSPRSRLRRVMRE